MTSEDPATLRRRKAHVLSDRLGLARDERIDLATIMLWRDIQSWDDLDDNDIKIMLAAMEGHIYLMFIRSGGRFSDIIHERGGQTPE